MVFRPKSHLWDTTLYEEGGIFHIFYLNNGEIGHVSTEDFLNYTEYPDIKSERKKGEWDEHGFPLTGSLVKTASGYKMLLGSLEPSGNSQAYGLFESDDLINWRAYQKNPVLKAGSGYYSAKVVAGYDWNFFSAWRDPSIYKKEGEWYYLCMCARSESYGKESTGAVIAHLKTKDFKTYEYLPPLTDLGEIIKYAECPDCFELCGDCYITFLDHGWGGMRIHTSEREDSSGTYYQKLNKESGRYEFLDEKLLIGSSGDRIGPWAARTCRVGDIRLLYCHIAAKLPAFAQPKVISKRKDGSLFLKYWDKLDALIGEGLKLSGQGIEGDMGKWTANGNDFCSDCPVFGSALKISDGGDISVKIKVSMSGARCGVSLRANAFKDEYLFKSLCIGLDFERKMIFAEELYYRRYEGYGRHHEDVVNGGWVRDKEEKRYALQEGLEYELSIFLREEFLEVYLDGVWQLSKAFNGLPATGGIHLFTERGKASFSVTANSLKEIVVNRF